MYSNKFSKIYIVVALFPFLGFGQNQNLNYSKFKQLKEEVASPNVYRTASGAPGHQYYQQKADYKMNLELDDKNKKLYGSETITYHNNAPESLEYLWVQMEQNIELPDLQSEVILGHNINKTNIWQALWLPILMLSISR